MPIITRIVSSQRRPNWQKIHFDHDEVIACKTNVLLRLGLCVGQQLNELEIAEIRSVELEQECRDAGLNLLSHRLHSEAELARKLLRKEYDQQTVDAVLTSLKQLGYLDDRRFAAAKSLSAMQHKQHGRRRAYMELLRSGVQSDVANRALDDVYQVSDSMAVARKLALKKAVSLRRLDPLTARRRLAGMLQRRGFEYESIKTIIDEVVGQRE